MITKQRIKDLAPEVSEKEKAKIKDYFDEQARDKILEFLNICFCISNKGVRLPLLVSEDLSLGAKIEKAIVKFDPSLGDLRPKCFSQNKLFILKDLKYLLGIFDCMLDFIQFGKAEEKNRLEKPWDDAPYWFHQNNLLITMIEELEVFVNERYNIIYNNEISRLNDYKPRGIYLKHNVEIIEAVKKTGDLELVDIIKSANRVGVVDLTEQLMSLNNFLEASVDGKKGFSWFESFVKHKFDDKDHPIASMMRNFQQAMNRCNIRHSHDQHHEKPSLEIQRILFDMGLTLVRLKLEFQNLEDVIKNEQ